MALHGKVIDSRDVCESGMYKNSKTDDVIMLGRRTGAGNNNDDSNGMGNQESFLKN